MNEQNLKKRKLEVVGMDCADCALRVEKAVQRVSGMKDVHVNFMNARMTVEYDENKASEGDISRAVRSAGYSLKTTDGKDKFRKRQFTLTSISGIFTIAGVILSQSEGSVFTIPAFLLAILSGGFPIARKGVKEAQRLTLGMDFLMSIAVIGAMIIGEWTEAAFVVFLFSLAQLIESFSIARARRSIESLLELAPDTALVKTAHGTESRRVENIRIGEIVVVRPGDRIPLDGVVLNGNSSVNQASVTGESLPVNKQKGDEVFAGTINQQGALEIEVTRTSENSMLAKIIRLVEEAQTRKAPTEQFVEKFSRYYTPSVVLFAVLVAVLPPLLWAEAFAVWFYRALVLLVISCPCALVISTPVTIVSALNNAARHGILVKGGSFLENFDRLEVIAFDKTGTLTSGDPAVHSVIPLNSMSEAAVMQIAGSLEWHSEHPLGRAIVDYCKTRNIAVKAAEQFTALSGKGAQGRVDGELYTIGNHRLFEEKGWCNDDVHTELEKIEIRRHTAVLVGTGEEIIGLIALSDAVRKQSTTAVKRLKDAGVERTVMLTGDNAITAEAIAREIGIDEYYAELLPEDKVSRLEELKEKWRYVAMVGDGVNDAPALAAATMGVSMGASGSDTAIETADIALMEDDLLKLSYLKNLSRKAVRIIKQNIFIALFLKAVFFVLAIPGFATLWMAVFADMGASLMVIFNGLRALKSSNATADSAEA